MVAIKRSRFIFCLLSILLTWMAPIVADEAQNVDISADMDNYNLVANRPLKGTVAITHKAEASIDTSSFLMDDKPLTVTLIKSVKMSPQSNVEVSIYQFELPPKPQGLYILSPISVKIGDQTYSSIGRSYEVTAPLQSSESSSPVTLNMSANVKGPSPLYPGQRTNFIYRFYFQGTIELVSEDLPLLKAAGFQRIGDEQAKDFQQGPISGTEVTQEVQALTSGDFHFPSSFIEGYAYKEGAGSKVRTYLEPKLRAETTELTVTVAPFPEEGKPASFNGAVGNFSMKTSLLTPAAMHVDDKIELAIDITGDDNLHTVNLPNLNDAGFKELFRLSDLPSTGEIHDKTKRFVVELYPLSTAVKEIPPLEFSFFNPDTNSYTKLSSQLIPITVTENEAPISSPPQAPGKPTTPVQVQLPVKAAPPVESQPPAKTAPSIQPQPPVESSPSTQVQLPIQVPSVESEMRALERDDQAILKPAPVEIESNYELRASDVINKPFGEWSAFWFFPAAILIIVLQVMLRRYLEAKKQVPKSKTSEEAFQEVLKTPFNTPEFFNLLNQAFMLLLVEKGEIPSANISPETLPTTGDAGRVRNFLIGLEARRFTGEGELERDQVMAEANTLLNEVGGHE